MINFGELLRAHRLRKGRTQTALAAALHVDQTTISKLERNERRPTAEFVEKVCAELNLSPSETDALRGTAGLVPRSELTWALGLRPVARRVLYWFTAGSQVGVFFLMFVLVRLFLVQGNVLALRDLFEGPPLGTHIAQIIAMILAVVVFAFPIGFLAHQIYFACYRSFGIRAGSSPVDRAYPVLHELEQRYDVNFPLRFGRTATDLEQIRARKDESRVSFTARRMRSIQDNWALLRDVWMDAITRGRIEYVDALIGFKEDTFSLQGASMVAAVTAFILYACYEWRVHGWEIQGGELSYAAGLVVNVFALVGILWVLRTVRSRTGEDAIETRRLFLYLAYEAGGTRSELTKGKQLMNEPPA